MSLVSTLFSGALAESFIGSGSQTSSFFFLLVLFMLLFTSFKIFNTKERVFSLYLTLFASSAILVVVHLLRVPLGEAFLSMGVLNTPTSSLLGRWNDLAIFFGLSSFISVVTLEFFKTKQDSKGSNLRSFGTLAFVYASSKLFFFMVCTRTSLTCSFCLSLFSKQS